MSSPESHGNTLERFALASAMLSSSASRPYSNLGQTERPLRLLPDLSAPLPEVKGAEDSQISGVLAPTSPSSKQKGTITRRTTALWRKIQKMAEGNQWLFSRSALKAVKRRNGKYTS